ncbi:GFA family protein [Qipengyuania sp. DSG2-2]|uniref:GFA family protein n=1 Tax=Qipengyuania sp. DGS2-2 TaxID=3349631 RepID=UPI0036D26A1F
MADTHPAPLTESISGHCLCGSVSITLEGARPEVDICHCAMCRRWGGAFFGGLKGSGFSVSGQEHVTSYRSSEWAERAFCKQCGSNLWYRFLPGDLHSFLAGLFDLPADVDASMGIEQQIFIDEKPCWYDLAQDSQKKTGPRKTGAQIIAEAKAAGFDIG